MPMYSYKCDYCKEATSRITPMEARDKQDCLKCNNPLKRGIDRPALVWAPTASNGAGHK